MSISKKHFEQFANEIRALVEDTQRSCERKEIPPREAFNYVQGLRHAARVFADVAAQSNPRFNRTRFMSACNL